MIIDIRDGYFNHCVFRVDPVGSRDVETIRGSNHGFLDHFDHTAIGINGKRICIISRCYIIGYCIVIVVCCFDWKKFRVRIISIHA